CGESGRRCSDRSALAEHRSLHAEERPHICGECGDSFQWSSALSVHLRIHRGETP
ncbi:ZN497 protein, partial [Dicaeum eximium]|nr:ZN497 protein [Dicaeum eximium]